MLAATACGTEQRKAPSKRGQVFRSKKTLPVKGATLFSEYHNPCLIKSARLSSVYYTLPYRVCGSRIEIVRVYHNSHRWPERL